MHHINGAYTTYFNMKRARSGHLFQGRYKAVLVDIDEYAKELSRYIHLNPVRAKMVEVPEAYDWSSYNFYTGEKKPPEWLYRDFILGYFGSKVSAAQNGYRQFVSSMVNKSYCFGCLFFLTRPLMGDTKYLWEPESPDKFSLTYKTALRIFNLCKSK